MNRYRRLITVAAFLTLLFGITEAFGLREHFSLEQLQTQLTQHPIGVIVLLHMRLRPLPGLPLPITVYCVFLTIRSSFYIKTLLRPSPAAIDRSDAICTCVRPHPVQAWRQPL